MSGTQPGGSDESDRSTAADTARGTRLRETVELQILPQLLALHAAPAANPTDQAARETLARLAVELAMDAAGPNPDRVQARLERLLDGGADPESLCLDVLAPAARHLGDLWVEDELDFVDVTLGTMRLERALRGLLLRSAPRQSDPVMHRSGHQPTILMTPLPGNQHTFGLSMAADFFRRGGWLVSEGDLPGPRSAVADGFNALEQQLRTRTFDAIGLAVSCETQLDLLDRTLRMVRAVSRNPRIRIALGGPLFLVDPDMAARIDADLVVTDAAQAPARLAALLPEPDAGQGPPGSTTSRKR